MTDNTTLISGDRRSKYRNQISKHRMNLNQNQIKTFRASLYLLYTFCPYSLPTFITVLKLARSNFGRSTHRGVLNQIHKFGIKGQQSNGKRPIEQSRPLHGQQKPILVSHAERHNFPRRPSYKAQSSLRTPGISHAPLKLSTCAPSSYR